MKFFKEKKFKLEKKLREIKPEIIKNIVARYERFCQDQHVYTLLQWRDRVDYHGLTPKQRVAFDLKLAFRKKNSYSLRNFRGEIIYDPL
jgi:hypothetical protein